MKIKTLLVLSLGFLSSLVHGNVRPANIFGNGMVLQRNAVIPVWGWADAGEDVIVQFHSQTRRAKAGRDGKWKVNFDAEKAGGPYVLSIKGKNSLRFTDVLVGDVWICSGQSNMEWSVSNSKDAKAEIKAANYPQIRHFKVRIDLAGKPLDDLKFEGAWKPASPENVGDFTAVGYFFARDLHKELNVPIGLINTSWGGTDIETWISKSAFENSSDFKQMISRLPAIDLDALAKAKVQEAQNLVKRLQGNLPTKEALASWSTASLDDISWPKMKVPQLWEQEALKDVDGIVWLRRIVEVSSEDAGKPALLSLGMIDDNDQTFLNGTKIGETSAYDVKRSYAVKGGLLKAGKNVIAVRVEDSGGGGGIYGEAADVALRVGDKTIPLAGEWSFGIETLKDATASISPNSFPTILYNAMIHPLTPFAMKGVIWYQGENNAGRAYEYRKSFPLMINDWRNKWGGTDFPFYFVQLASFKPNLNNIGQDSEWAELREAQSMALVLPNTGMAVATDIGEATDIHPRNKQDVGHRLAAVALRNAYGKQIVAAGPAFKSMKIEGNRIRISFSDIGSGLFIKDGSGNLSGFDIAGEDRKLKIAKAIIEGNEVIVYHDEVSKPVAVRYNWADFGEGNLYNKEGFPASPFRTDDWAGKTINARYSVSEVK